MFKPAAVIYTKSGNTFIRALSTAFNEDTVRTAWVFFHLHKKHSVTMFKELCFIFTGEK